MNENQFNAMLAIIVPHIIELIIKNSNLDTDKAISLFYNKNFDYPEKTLKYKHIRRISD